MEHIKINISILVIIGLLLASYKVKSQDNDIDRLVNKIEFTQDTLASVIQWMSGYFSYDLSILENGTYRYDNREKLINTFLKSRKGVCEHFSITFNAIANYLGYESHLVAGYLIGDDRSSATFSHQWNAVVVNDEWFFYDPTWASGYVEGGKYYKDFDRDWIKIKPHKLIESHIPFDPMWQLLSQPIRHSDIDTNLALTVDGDAEVLTPTMIRGELLLPEKERLIRKIDRIEKSGITNPLIKMHLNDTKGNLKSAQEAIGIDLINEAISNFNDVVTRFNVYLQKRADVPGSISKINTSISDLNRLLLEIDEVESNILNFSMSDNHNSKQILKVANEIKKIQIAIKSELKWLKGL